MRATLAYLESFGSLELPIDQPASQRFVCVRAREIVRQLPPDWTRLRDERRARARLRVVILVVTYHD